MAEDDLRVKDKMRRRTSLIGEALVFLSYASIVAVMTWPAITLTSRTYGQRGDAMGTLWDMWWFKFAAANHIPANPVTWVSVPFGKTMAAYSRDLLSTSTLRGLSIATTETVAYNVFLLFAYFLAAAAMYFLVRRLTKSRPAAAIAGLIFAFSPYMLMQGKEHISLVTVAWLPVFFYLMIRAWQERSILFSILCAASFVLMALFNFHYGLIGGTMGAVFLLSVWLMGKPWKSPCATGTVVISVLVIIVGVASLLVFAYVRRGAASIDLTGTYLYSARPWDYLLPHADAAVLGWTSRGFIFSHLHGGFLSESSLFLGYVPLGFAVFALVRIWRDRGRRRLEAKQIDADPLPARVAGVKPATRIPLALAVCGGICFLLSMPPTASILGVKVYLPSYLIHFFVPEVRAYARFGIGVLFSVAVLAAYGISMLLEKKWWSRWNKVLVTFVIGLLILVEFSIVPPFHSLSTGNVTDYYRWLKNVPGNPVVAVYPFFYTDDFQNYDYFFNQRHHEKRLVNGSDLETEAETIRQVSLDITNPATPGTLKTLGVRYVLAIPSLYREGNHVNYIDPVAFDPDKVAPGLKKVKEFKDGIIYEDVAPRAEVTSLFTAGAEQPIVHADGTAWHPSEGTMSVNIRSKLKATAVANVEFEAYAAGREGRIAFGMEGTGTVASRLQVWPRRFTLESVSIRPGDNILTIKADAPLAQVTEVPGATTVGASVMVSDIEVVSKP